MTTIADLKQGDKFYHNDKLLKVRDKYFTTNTGNSYLPVEYRGKWYEFRCFPDQEIELK